LSIANNIKTGVRITERKGVRSPARLSFLKALAAEIPFNEREC
jgi:hypothetical protein